MYDFELEAALIIGEKAKKVVLDFYKSDRYQVEIKNDKSPVTTVDKLSNDVIRDFLLEKFPKYAVLCEETNDDKSRLDNDYVWIVDPIDGTKEYIACIDDFTINIALSCKHEIVLGVIFVPARDEIYYAVKNQGAFLIEKNKKPKRISCIKNKDKFVYVTSNFHTTKGEEILIDKNKGKIESIIKAGAAYKCCLIAKGLADISFRITDRTKEWDTAVCSILLQEAGGIVLNAKTFRPLIYNRDDIVNRDGYIILNDPSLIDVLSLK